MRLLTISTVIICLMRVGDHAGNTCRRPLNNLQHFMLDLAIAECEQIVAVIFMSHTFGTILE